MKISKRSLLGTAAVSVLGLEIAKNFLGSSNARSSGEAGKRQGTEPKAPAPTPPGPPIPITFYNFGGEPATGAVISFFQPFRDGDVPIGGGVEAQDSGGKVVEVQLDAATTWPSGHLAGGVLTLKASEVIQPKGSVRYLLVPRSSPSQRGLDPAWGARPALSAPDIRCVYSGGDAGSQTYTVSLRTILSSFNNYPWGTSYPRGGWEVVKSGPHCIEWHAWQYLTNDSTKVPHGYVRCDMWVKALGVNGPYELDVRTSMPNMWNAISQNSERHGKCPNRFASRLSIVLGEKPIANFGGRDDPRGVTISSDAFRASSQSVSLPLKTGAHTGFQFSGELPSGLSADRVYWPSGGRLYNQRLFVSYVEQNGPFAPWQPKTQYGYNSYVSSNGRNYYSLSGGISGSRAPTGEGGSDGAVTWEAISPVFGAPAKGEVVASPVYSCFPNSAWQAADPNGDALWVGPTPRPQIFPGHDFDYLTQKSKALPPFNPKALVRKTNLTTPIFGPNQLFGSILWYQSTTGDSNGDQRIGYVDNWGVVSLYSPDDPFYTRCSIQSALSWLQSLNHFLGDERNGLPFAGNDGKSNSGTAYPNFPTPVPSWVQNNIAGDFSQHTFGIGKWVPWYDSSVGNSGLGGQGFGSYSHSPCPMQIPYLKTGRACFADQLVWYANSNAMSTYKSFAKFGNQTTYSAINNGGSVELRGWAWALRSLCQGLLFTPDNHPFKQVLRDYYDAHFAYQAFCVNTAPPKARPLGILPFLDHYPGGYAPWEYHFLDMAVSMEKWRGALTSASVTNVDRLFRFMRNHYQTYSEGNNIYYIGAYDQQYSPKPQDWSASFTTADQALSAGFGPSGRTRTAFPPPAGAINSSYSRGGAPSWAFDDPQSTTDTAVIAQCALKIRAVADPGDVLISDLLSRTKKAIATHTHVSEDQGGIYWSFYDNARPANYHVYSCF